MSDTCESCRKRVLNDRVWLRNTIYVGIMEGDKAEETLTREYTAILHKGDHQDIQVNAEG